MNSPFCTEKKIDTTKTRHLEIVLFVLKVTNRFDSSRYAFYYSRIPSTMSCVTIIKFLMPQDKNKQFRNYMV